jgi:hypothetical protein
MVLELYTHTGTEGSSEDILVLLFWEVHIIVSMWMWELSWVVSIILPKGVRSKIFRVTITPVLDLKIADGFALVEVTDTHSSLIGLVVNSLGSKEPLSLLSETLKDVVWAHLHNTNLLIEAFFLSSRLRACLILSNLSITSFWNVVWLKSHELGLLHVWVAETTVLVSEGLTFSVWIPVIMGLIMSMILIERVI